MQKKCKIICVCQKKAVLLSSISPLKAKFVHNKLHTIIATLAQLVEQRIRNA